MADMSDRRKRDAKIQKGVGRTQQGVGGVAVGGSLLGGGPAMGLLGAGMFAAGQQNVNQASRKAARATALDSLDAKNAGDFASIRGSLKKR